MDSHCNRVTPATMIEEGCHMATPAKSPGGHWVICRYIVKNGRKIYRKNGGCFRFWVDDSKRK